ncbi:hypothetical protein [Streptomyces sp. NPDC001880]
MQRPGAFEATGRGLQPVDALADQWGVDGRQAGIGKTVWAELSAPGAAPVPRPAGATTHQGQAFPC